MGDPVRVGTLEIDQDLRYQRLEWRIERISWVLGALVLLAGVAGLFGSGPLSTAEAAGGSGLRVSYDRFLRDGSTSRLTILTETGGSPVLEVLISRAYLSGMRVDRVFPEPRRIEAAGDWMRCHFDVEPRSRAEIVLDLEPTRPGGTGASLRIGGGGSVSFWQFVYP